MTVTGWGRAILARPFWYEPPSQAHRVVPVSLICPLAVHARSIFAGRAGTDVGSVSAQGDA